MIKKIFVSGVKAFVPIALTVAIVIWLFSTLETFFGKFLLKFMPMKYYFPGLGIILSIVLIFLLGILVNAWMINRLYRLAERIVKKIPIIKTIYNSIQDFVAYFDKDKQANQQAVCINTELGVVIGLVTRDSLKGLKLGDFAEDKILVYIPLSYTVGGITVMMPRKEVTPIDWPVDKAMSFVLTAGMVGKK